MAPNWKNIFVSGIRLWSSFPVRVVWRPRGLLEVGALVTFNVGILQFLDEALTIAWLVGPGH